jgi:ABC-2 type transport system permease protein
MGIIQPILWLTLLGKAMNIGSIIPNIPGVNSALVMQNTFGTSDYFSYMAMGMVAFTTVFTSAFVGISVDIDKAIGLLSKVLSTPVTRSVIISQSFLPQASAPCSNRHRHRFSLPSLDYS